MNNNNNNSLTILYTNADSLGNKLKELDLLINRFQHKPNIVAITEVKSKVKNLQLKLSEFNLNGYNILSNDLDINSRGIIVYIDKNIEFSVIECNITFDEYILIKIKTNDNSYLTICVIYRSPNSSEINNESLFNIFRFVLNQNSKVMFIGDFNFPGINWNEWISKDNNRLEMKFISVLQDNFLIQNVMFLTRARGSDNPHTLDLVISNDDFIEEIQNLAPLGKSDHSVLLISSSVLNKKQYQNKLNFKKGDYEGLITALDIDWANVLAPFNDNINDMWNEFKNIVDINCDKFIPKAHTFDSWKKKDWKCPIPIEVRSLI